MASGKRQSGSRRREPWWAKLPSRELLGVQLCDLELEVSGTALESRLDLLHRQLERRGLRFRPHTWLSTDWFTPDGVVGFAIPFFLAHWRLQRLEHRMMFEVEGGSRDWCMRLLRHETGHAIDNAYRLHWRKRWREVFGPFSTPYRMSYTPNPLSRRFVQNLGYWYAQSHPAEDFAETFAVWLQPSSRWRTHYQGWPARKKLLFVDELMQSVRSEPMKVRSRARPESLSRLKLTLGEYYERKRDFYRIEGEVEYDGHLDLIFSSDRAFRGNETAASFLRRHRSLLRTRIAAQTGAYRYVVDQALHVIEVRCKQRQLRVVRSARATLVELAMVLTILTMGFLRGSHRPFSR